eukprot:gnl/TRDRNA2_/TRDRNA2_171368_c0_seq3.p1 gnl/TRDRNA2_/TRDRNA2_171368_c0~~gnl/TRDRNA2_/TRDRNA2_171368_c0_seq3.p1  ORF type:complete len:128 (+),score=25.77 gnl/TRDRNA2_/TRDRNA2_171368_c0_seq3:224-607(+)
MQPRPKIPPRPPSSAPPPHLRRPLAPEAAGEKQASQEGFGFRIRLSNVPREYSHAILVEMHGSLGLDPKSLLSSSFLPLESKATETCKAVLTYTDRESADLAVEELKGQRVAGASGAVKILLTDTLY